MEDSVTKGPHINYTTQFNLAKSVEKHEILITDLLKSIASKKKEGSWDGGLLLIYGDFESVIDGVHQMSTNTVQGNLVYITDSDIEETLIEYMLDKANDGAIIVNSDGQVLGTNVYLFVDNPETNVPDQTGTRHIAASSFSKREDVYSSFVLSETKNVISIFKDGEVTERFTCDDDKAGKNGKQTKK